MGNRVRQVSLAEATPDVRKIYQQIFGDRDPVAQPGTTTGSPGDYWNTLALVPDLFKLATDIVWASLQPGRKLEPRYRELAILRTAIVGDCKFEYSQHLKLSRALNQRRKT
jgi:alkylhydroperoxidase family enzyme